MKDIKDIDDDQIRVIGSGNRKKKINMNWSIISIIILLAVVIVLFSFMWNKSTNNSEQIDISDEEELITDECNESVTFIDTIDIKKTGFTEIKDTIIESIPLRIYIPHNAELILHIGKMNLNDQSVIFAAQAADIRADNGGIVGAFVFKGEPRAWGLSKEGFCASINGKVTIGVARNSSLFEKATEEDGYFFRQYPLVHKGKIVKNKPKGKSIRRSLCQTNGKVFMVESLIKITFYDFSKSLVSLGVNEGIYLVSSTSYGWATDKNNVRHEFGDKSFYTGERTIPENVNYIVWKRKQ